METRNYRKVIAEISHHWETEGTDIRSGDDGFSSAVYSAMREVASEGITADEKNKFYSAVYKILKTQYE